jgi:UrcA family protein
MSNALLACAPVKGAGEAHALLEDIMLKTTLFLALLSVATPTVAQSHPATAAATRVRIADLNLTNAIGAAELDRRIGEAVKLVCPDPQGRDLKQAIALKSCRIAATRSALGQRDAALAAGRTDVSIRVAAVR